MPTTESRTTCCIVGGGPAGVMLAYLLARRGVHVTVLEKHGDFFRDFRGDTVHPSTLEVMHELGILEEFLQVPHHRVNAAGAVVGDFGFKGPDFSHVPAHCKFVALMPQWDFLNFLSERAARYPEFQLLLNHEAVDLIHQDGRIAGVVAKTPGGESQEMRADLVVACDGRHSTVRRAGQLELIEFGVPMDVLWFRISRRPRDPAEVLGNVNYGKMLILIYRGDYFQAGLIIPKGSFDEVKRRGLEAFRDTIRQIAPFLDDRPDEIQDWDQVKILTVQLNRLRRWHRPGLLCIGDAAHAMSPVGGVGINLAIQDAVAAANILAEPLLRGLVTQAALVAVQKRREFPARVTQGVQAIAHKQIAKVFANPGPLQAPWQLKAITRIPGVHRALGYAVGIGIRPEHVEDARRDRRPVIVKVGAAIGAAAGGAVLAFWAVRRLRGRALKGGKLLRHAGQSPAAG